MSTSISTEKKSKRQQLSPRHFQHHECMNTANQYREQQSQESAQASSHFGSGGGGGGGSGGGGSRHAMHHSLVNRTYASCLGLLNLSIAAEKSTVAMIDSIHSRTYIPHAAQGDKLMPTSVSLPPSLFRFLILFFFFVPPHHPAFILPIPDDTS